MSPVLRRRAVLRTASAACGASLAAAALAACGASSSSAGGAKETPTAEPNELVMLVASSLTDVFAELAVQFGQQPENAGFRATFDFGASSQLRTQLDQGAPADLFASADTVQMDAAVKAGDIRGLPRIFVRNRLALIVPKDNRAGIHDLADLARPGLKLVTTARDVPVGNYTRQALAKMAADPQFGAGFDQKALANVVSEEANVRQLVTKVQLGEADAGICYRSDVTPKVAPDVQTIDIPDRYNTVAEYPVGVAKRARAPQLAQRFVAYLLSPEAQGVFQQYNFIPAA